MARTSDSRDGPTPDASEAEGFVWLDETDLVEPTARHRRRLSTLTDLLSRFW